jgi:hypothetical protein
MEIKKIKKMGMEAVKAPHTIQTVGNCISLVPE